jgi:hypothetical protein
VRAAFFVLFLARPGLSYFKPGLARPVYELFLSGPDPTQPGWRATRPVQESKMHIK